ncbi:MAG: hypothetical protein H0V01_11755 [Bacteroidetes bacterium]|nr:hypothetical protein [Bacteroidota bacterium]HET6243798.1 hypothetical protein [Bacteroidia bacterium]
MKIFVVILTLIILACNTIQPDRQVDKNAKNKPSISRKIDGIDVFSYSIYTENDTIEYIKIGTDTLSSKPIILFLQGSLPVPLIFDFVDFKHINIPFEYSEFIAYYHLIEISMPKTPIVAGQKNLNQEYCYIVDTVKENTFKQEYLKDNYLENYVNRTNQVISDLQKKEWFKNDSIHLIGHSQGAKIAAVVASENSNISTVSLLGFNAFGRYDEYVRRERQKLKTNKITGEEYKSNIDELYERWTEINQKPKDFENGNNSITTFSIDYIPYLLNINIPIFVGYGTEDIILENCDLLPISFIQHQKSNLTLKPYVGLDHNFFEVKDGRPDFKNRNHWTDVIKEIIEWTKSAK